MTRRFLPAAALALGLATTCIRPAASGEPVPFGRWLTERANAAVEIAPCEPAVPGQLCGRIVWLWQPHDESGQPRRDSENQAPDRRQRPLIGTEILTGFVAKAPGHWGGGRIYNPEDGRTYDATLRMQGPDTLVVEGCVLFICRKQTWRMAKGACS